MVIAGPAALMPCLSRNAVTVLMALSSVSNAESQVAVPLTKTIVRAGSVTSSPNGSAGCGGAALGVAGSAGVAGGAWSAGVAGVAGAGVAGAGVGGVCAK